MLILLKESRFKKDVGSMSGNSLGWGRQPGNCQYEQVLYKHLRRNVRDLNEGNRLVLRRSGSRPEALVRALRKLQREGRRPSHIRAHR